jgi:hypothetical protein
MAVTLKDAAATAAAEALRPLIDLLLEVGITSPETESLVRAAYVHAAKEKIEAAREKPTNVRIALLTGLHRNEVAAKLETRPRIDPERQARTYGANKVLKEWYHDPRFCLPNGEPRLLPLAGKGSFELLVKEYAPNISPSIVLEELERMRAVERIGSNEVRARADRISPPGLDGDSLEELGVRLKDYGRTLAHNLLKPGQAYLAETAMSIEIAPQAVALLQRLVRDRTAVYMSEVESEMSDPRLKRDARAGDGRVRMGVSVFWFEETLAPARAGQTGADAGGPKGARRPKAGAQRRRKGKQSTTMSSRV